MRLIDGDKLIRKYIDTDIEKFSNSDVKIVLENLKQNILKAPSIDIVRCKKCKYFSVISDEEEGTNYYMCGVWSNATDKDAFCSYGKERTSDEEISKR